MDIVPSDIPEQEIRKEADFRTHRAGLTTQSGGPIPLKIMSQPSTKRYRDNYEKIFKHK